MVGLLLAAPAAAQEAGGFYYRVLPGDSWTSVARRMGLTVTQLQAVNPEYPHPKQWLFPGQTIFIPVNFGDVEVVDSYTVQLGDSWASIADAYGLPLRALWAANPRLLRPHLVLRPGNVVAIPAGGLDAPVGEDEGEIAQSPEEFLRAQLTARYSLSGEAAPQIEVIRLNGEMERLLAYTTGSLFAVPAESSLTAHFAALYAPGDLAPLAQFDLPDLLAQVDVVTLAGDGRTLLITGSYLPGGVFFLLDLGDGESVEGAITQLYEGAGGRTVHAQLYEIGPDRYGVLARYAPGGPIPQGLFTDAFLAGPVGDGYGEIYSQRFGEGALIAGVEPSPELAEQDLPTVAYRFVPGENPDYFDMEMIVTYQDVESVQRYRFEAGGYVAVSR